MGRLKDGSSQPLFWLLAGQQSHQSIESNILIRSTEQRENISRREENGGRALGGTSKVCADSWNCRPVIKSDVVVSRPFFTTCDT